ncbi:MAG: 2-polyprenyl-6-methoxyphenol hydroxylase, partial [Jatrophihabitantaceae bacterium]
MSRAGSDRRVAIVGGGPAGLFLARMVRLRQPEVAVDLYERKGIQDTFGFGVSLSDRTLHQIVRNDPATHERIVAASVGLAGVELRLPGGRVRYDGFG